MTENCTFLLVDLCYLCLLFDILQFFMFTTSRARGRSRVSFALRKRNLVDALIGMLRLFFAALFVGPFLHCSFPTLAFSLAARPKSSVSDFPMDNDKNSAAAAGMSSYDRPSLELTFPEDCLAEDHYGGVTLYVDRLLELTDDNETRKTQQDILRDFDNMFTTKLARWQAEKKRGIWVHLPIEASDLVPILAKEQFLFHMVVGTVLVMTRWLPVDSESRLPRGPTHQVGIGCLIYKPNDPTKILVVKEKSGPAAAYDLWKMPTGLSDADEDIHQAALRELQEETGLRSTFDGLACLRQAPVPKQNHGLERKFASSRKAADLFFVCRLSLQDRPEGGESDEEWQTLFKACPDEIAAIRWMKVDDFCSQALWQNSPLYQQLNKIVLNGGDERFWKHSTMPIRGDSNTENTLYHPGICVQEQSHL